MKNIIVLVARNRNRNRNRFRSVHDRESGKTSPNLHQWTIPNLISGYRLAALPVIAGAMACGHQSLFAALIVINLLSDILDGALARALHQETEFGARLDSLADLGTFMVALAGLFVFERGFITAHATACAVIIGLYCLPQFISLVRFRRPVCLHLYSSKLTGYAQGIFFGILFLFGFHPAIFYPMMALCLFNYAEETAILLVLRERCSNARGIYWVLRKRVKFL